MVSRFFKEALIVLGATLFFLVLCATVGISMSTPPASPTAEAAQAEEHASEDLDVDRSSVHEIEAAVSVPLPD